VTVLPAAARHFRDLDMDDNETPLARDGYAEQAFSLSTRSRKRKIWIPSADSGRRIVMCGVSFALATDRLLPDVKRDAVDACSPPSGQTLEAPIEIAEESSSGWDPYSGAEKQPEAAQTIICSSIPGSRAPHKDQGPSRGSKR